MLWGCDWNAGLLQSMLSGGVSGGLGGALGWAAKQAKAVVRKALGEGSRDLLSVSHSAVVPVNEANLVNIRRMPSSEEMLENGAGLGTPRSPGAWDEAVYASENLLRRPGEPKLLTIDDVTVMTKPSPVDGSQTVYTPSRELVDRYADDWRHGLAKVSQVVIEAAQRDGYIIPADSLVQMAIKV
jgi:hypothetical protein